MASRMIRPTLGEWNVHHQRWVICSHLASSRARSSTDRLQTGHTSAVHHQSRQLAMGIQCAGAGPQAESTVDHRLATRQLPRLEDGHLVCWSRLVHRGHQQRDLRRQRRVHCHDLSADGLLGSRQVWGADVQGMGGDEYCQDQGRSEFSQGGSHRCGQTANRKRQGARWGRGNYQAAV